MNFDYRTVGSTISRLTPVSLLELATNVVTDWMPGTPNSLALCFVDLLATTLDSKAIMGGDVWTVQSRVASFEKQWKQATSWILGVAFSRKIFEMEGYPWWASVSAFTSPTRRWAPSSPYWYPNFPTRQCRIIKPTPRRTRLMPDYILARNKLTQPGHEISFAESKGSQRNLEFLDPPPSPWINQARNAEFYYRRVHVPATRNMLVATRINPRAKRPVTRRIYVRVWNSEKPHKNTHLGAFREVLMFHYFGICERIGMGANAKLLALNSYADMMLYPSDKRDFYYERLTESRKELIGMAKNEIIIEETQDLPNEPIFFSSKRSKFTVGENVMRIGLSSQAMDLVKWLQEGNEEYGIDFSFRKFNKRVNELRNFSKEIPSLCLRKDGVVSEFL